MTVQLGINLLTWMNDDPPPLDVKTSLDMYLSGDEETGFAGLELSDELPREARLLGLILQHHDLQLVSDWYSGRPLERSVEKEITAVQPYLTLLREPGARVPAFAKVNSCIHGEQQTPVHLRPCFPQERWQGYGEKPTEFARYTQQQGVRIAYYHHVETMTESAEDVDNLITNTGDEVGLLSNTGHLTFASIDLLVVVQRWASRINHIHCKDVRAGVLADIKNRKTSFLDAVLSDVFTVPGGGCVDYPPIMTLLKANQYQGWLVVEVEQDPAIMHPLAHTRPGYNNLGRLAWDTGLIRGGDMPRLLSHWQWPDAQGCTQSVAPESAGWGYIGSRAYEPEERQQLMLPVVGEERCLVLIAGHAIITMPGATFTDISERMSPFERIKPWAVCVTAGETIQVQVVTRLELAACAAPGEGMHSTRLIAPKDVDEETRDKGHNQRYMHDILPEDKLADSLLVMEVWTSEGCTSSYPSHEHDADNPSQETYLEETCCHRLNPPQRFCIRRVYTDDRSLNECMAVYNRDMMMVLKEYHPVATLAGYDSYYPNVMAGPVRRWMFIWKDEHVWINRDYSVDR